MNTSNTAAAPSQQHSYKLEVTSYVLTSAHGWQWRMKAP
jgi:hypothetical protein